jgi:hypothetical protein
MFATKKSSSKTKPKTQFFPINQANVQTTMNTNQPDDSFQLYDLRIELICPEGERILCGAKPGDYFTLQGEMLSLPPDQGISIYSLGMYASFR